MILKWIRRRLKHCYRCGTKIVDTEWDDNYIITQHSNGGVALIKDYGWGYVCISCSLEMSDPEAWNYDIDNDEGQQIHLCSTLLPVICEHHQTLDDCGSEACAKFGHTWNTWKGEDGCEMMGEQGYSPYDEVEK